MTKSQNAKAANIARRTGINAHDARRIAQGKTPNPTQRTLMRNKGIKTR